MNKLILKGYITHDINFLTLKNGGEAANFILSVKRNSYKDVSCDFFRITAFYAQAKVVKDYYEKGDLVIVTGHLQNSQYEKNGVKIVSTDIILESIDPVVYRGKKEFNPESKPTLENEDSKYEDKFDDEEGF